MKGDETIKLDNRTIKLIALGAAIGANCQSCMRTNFAKALEAGAVEQEIAEAIEIGKMVRMCAASKMDELASSLGKGEPSFTADTNSGCGCEAASLADAGGQNG